VRRSESDVRAVAKTYAKSRSHATLLLGLVGALLDLEPQRVNVVKHALALVVNANAAVSFTVDGSIDLVRSWVGGCLHASC
jgi:hypothetical protein